MAGPLLAAAAIFLVVRGRDATPGGSMPTEPAVRFKGSMHIAVVRDRGGDQRRLLGEVRIQPGDRLRVEVSLDESRPVEVGFLGKDGTWLPLLAPALMEAGTHFSERAARFDDTPTEGWILAGYPEDVKHAKASHSFDDVSVVAIVTEP